MFQPVPPFATVSAALSVSELAESPPLKEMRVEVALFGKRYAKPPVVHDCATTLPVASMVRHCPADVLRPETTSADEDAVFSMIAGNS